MGGTTRLLISCQRRCGDRLSPTLGNEFSHPSKRVNSQNLALGVVGRTQASGERRYQMRKNFQPPVQGASLEMMFSGIPRLDLKQREKGKEVTREEKAGQYRDE